jgi:hypothetical protein
MELDCLHIVGLVLVRRETGFPRGYNSAGMHWVLINLERQMAQHRLKIGHDCLLQLTIRNHPVSFQSRYIIPV